MKRLNFEQAPAEKSSMNRIDPFFVVIILLLSGLATIYNASYYGLGDSQLQAAENLYLKNKIKILELKQKDLEFKTTGVGHDSKGRSLASVEDPETDPSKIAEKLYKDVVEQCIKRKKDLLCLDKVDSVLTQFPESKWAGKTLVVLTDRYIKEKRYEQAADLVQIVRNEFKSEPEVQALLREMEKSQL